MTTINKRRSGDENIWKLIVFAITIVIAIGLVGLVSYFYTQNREVAVNTSVLADETSSAEDIQTILSKYDTDCVATDYSIDFNAISWIYWIENLEAACTLELVKWINVSGSGYTIR